MNTTQKEKKVLNQPVGHHYSILQEREKKIRLLLGYARDGFTYPCLYHFTSHIHSADNFIVARFLQDLKRAISKTYNFYFKQADVGKSRKRRGSPNTLAYYSIEHKEGDFVDTDGNALPRDYLHIHLHLVVDCVSGYRPHSVAGFILKALNDINGLKSSQYHKRYADNGFGDLYHNLKVEFEDAVLRGTYLAKLDQKDINKIPYKKTWGCNRVKTT